MTLATNWVDNIGMFVNAAYLNQVGNEVNANIAQLAGLSAIHTARAASVTTSETSTSVSTYGDLATTTDQVIVTIGASGLAIVLLGASIWCASGGGGGRMSFDVSGANTLAADDSRAIMQNAEQTGVHEIGTVGRAILLTGLSAGSTTFKAKYKGISFNVAFSNRHIAVIPL